MAKIRTYKCPGSDGSPHTFDYLHHPHDEPPPRFCPKCGYDSQADEIELEFHPAVTSPRVLSGQVKAKIRSANATYRQYEKATEERASEAAAILNVPASEMSDLKVTNFETQLRQGDYAVKPVDNSVSQFMQQNRTVVQNMQSPQVAMGLAAQAHTGKDAYAGAKAASMLRGIHEQRGGPISSVPTKELLDQSVRTGRKATF
jgi:hypothetical protein